MAAGEGGGSSSSKSELGLDFNGKCKWCPCTHPYPPEKCHGYPDWRKNAPKWFLKKYYPEDFNKYYPDA